jgi:hypothetical protein
MKLFWIGFIFAFLLNFISEIVFFENKIEYFVKNNPEKAMEWILKNDDN